MTLHYQQITLGWSLELTGPDGGSRQLDAAQLAVVEETAERVVWRRADGLTVEIGREPDGGELLLSFRYHRLPPEYQVTAIHFPVATLADDRDFDLTLPVTCGMLVHQVRRHIFSQAAPGNTITSRYNSMQFISLLFEDTGYFFSTCDTRGYLKEWQIDETTSGAIRCQSIFPMPRGRHRDSFSLPYRGRIARFDGGWVAAARLYRNWALQQFWAVNQPSPGPLRDVAAWVWNRGKIAEVIPPVERLADDLQLPVALDWYWWHQSEYDTAYPDYFPPREGEAAFTQAIDRLNARGILTQVYTNGSLWDARAASWPEGGEASAALQPDGSLFSCDFNRYNPHPLTFMCGMGLEFRRKIVETADRLRHWRLPMLYLDVITCNHDYLCCNPHHAHEPGGGNYQVQGFRELFREIRRNNPGLLLCSEECSEDFLDLVEANIVVYPSQERALRLPEYQEAIPLFMAVYHGRHAFFGNYALMDGIPPYDDRWPDAGRFRSEKAWHRLCPEQFALEVARNVVWGMQPTVATLRQENLDRPEFAADYTFFKDAAAFYHRHRQFLFDGQLGIPGAFSCPQQELHFLQRGLYTKEGEENLSSGIRPAVLHAVWESPDGRRMLILANYTYQAADWEYTESTTRRQGRLEARSLAAVPLPAE